MFRVACILLLACALETGLLAGEDEAVFRSDVSLVRVDAQVVDSSNRAITRLLAGDFILSEDKVPCQQASDGAIAGVDDLGVYTDQRHIAAENCFILPSQ